MSDATYEWLCRKCKNREVTPDTGGMIHPDNGCDSWPGDVEVNVTRGGVTTYIGTAERYTKAKTPTEWREGVGAWAEIGKAAA